MTNRRIALATLAILVAVHVVIVISIIPVWAAQKLAGPIEGDEAKTVGIAEP